MLLKKTVGLDSLRVSKEEDIERLAEERTLRLDVMGTKKKVTGVGGTCCREFHQLGHALEGSPNRVRGCLWASGLWEKIKHLSWLTLIQMKMRRRKWRTNL